MSRNIRCSRVHRRWLSKGSAGPLSVARRRVALVLALTGVVLPTGLASAGSAAGRAALPNDPAAPLPTPPAIAYAAPAEAGDTTCTAGGSCDIWVYDSADGSRINITNTSDVSEYAPALSPDGASIAYVRHDNSEAHQQIWVMRANGTHRQPVAAHETRESIDPTWSPDGRRIAFTRGIGSTWGIWTINADGSGLYPVSEQANIRMLRPDWSPNGKQIVVERHDGPARGEIWVVNADGTGGAQRWAGGHGFDDFTHPAWSPDGKEIAFSGNPDGAVGGIMVMEARQGAPRRQLTGGNANVLDHQPAWSTTGDQVVFARYRSVRSSHIYAVNSLDGSQEQLIVEGEAPAPRRGSTLPPGPCTPRTITFSQIEAVGCFAWNGAAWEATDGAVRVNGIDFKSTGKITLDPVGGRFSVLGKVTVSAGDVTLLVTEDLDWNLNAEVTLTLPPGFTLKGFPIDGSAKFGWENGYAKVELEVKLPERLGGVSGKAGFTANNEAGLQLKSLSVGVEKALLAGRLQVKDLLVTYKQEGEQWTGEGIIVLPTQNSVEVTAELTFKQGLFDSGRLGVTNINKHIANGVFLQSIGFGVKTDPLTLEGEAGLSAGPAIDRKMAAELNGKLTYTFADPDVFKVSGELKVVELELANGSIEYRSTGKVNLAGNLEFEKLGVTVNGQLVGWIDGTEAFNIEGEATIGVPFFSLTGKAVASTVGMAACGTVEGFVGEASLGVGYKWHQSADFLTSCDLGPYTELHIKAAVPEPVYEIPVPAGSEVAAVRVVGATAPPRITLVDPNGQLVPMPEKEKEGVTSQGHLVVTNPVTKTTYVALGKPAAGIWQIKLEKGSSAIAEVHHADSLPPVAVEASVERTVPDLDCLSCKFVLHWSLKPIPGQKVTFAEVGHETSHVIGTADGESGSIKFAPGAGSGERKIVAIVEQDGLPRTNISVASFDYGK